MGQQQTISKCLDPSDHRSRERQIVFCGTGKDGTDEILDTKIEVVTIYIVNSRAIEAIRLQEFVRDV